MSVPLRFYKVILDNRPPERKAIGFVLPNAKSGRPLREYAVPVDEVEKLTGIDFYSFLPFWREGRLEKACSPDAWPGMGSPAAPE